MPVLEFGEYAPDIPDLANAGTEVAKNVIPAVIGFEEFKSEEVFSDALDGYARGFLAVFSPDGDFYSYAGDGTKLYMMSSNSWADAGTGYSLGSEEVWDILKGDTQVIAATINEHVQVDTIGTGTFSPLITSTAKPKANTLANVRGFLVLGDTDETTEGRRRNGVRWSALGNSADFDAAAATQSGFEYLEGNGGKVQKIIGGPHGLVFMEREIWLMQYAGLPVIFRFDRLSENRGLLAPQGAIQVGSSVYFLDAEGFFKMPVTGGEPVPIGKFRVDETVINSIDNNNLHRVRTVADPTNSTIYWSYPTTGGNPDKIAVYNYFADRWSLVERNHELICVDRTKSATLDESTYASLSIDAEDYNMDSSIYQGGAVRVGMFDLTHRLNYFTGTGLDAVLETGEKKPDGDAEQFIRSVRPLVSGSSATTTVQVGTRNLLTDTVSWSSAASVNSTNGRADLRSRARYMRFRANISGGFDSALGFEVEPKVKGKA
tara:strand:- start:175 stop:1641 length:1467 start_codon:yes stop_codon:yes gene_type:complete